EEVERLLGGWGCRCGDRAPDGLARARLITCCRHKKAVEGEALDGLLELLACPERRSEEPWRLAWRILPGYRDQLLTWPVGMYRDQPNAAHAHRRAAPPSSIRPSCASMRMTGPPRTGGVGPASSSRSDYAPGTTSMIV